MSEQGDRSWALRALGRRAAALAYGRNRSALADRVRSMAVMAHQDDDLYFLNPLLARQLRHSEAHLTVCLTAGEADGRNAPNGTAEYEATPVDRRSFAAARFAGLRCAYADMVLDDSDAKWRREVVTLAGGAEAEEAVLVDAPHVRLVLLNLWCAVPPDAAPGSGILPALWAGEAESTPTMIPTGSPVGRTHQHTREGLLNSLVELMREFDPTLLWTMDPDPDLQVHNRDNPRYADSGDFSDHAFHTVTGLFAHEAATRWFAQGGGTRTLVEAFRGYYVRRWPSNLSPEGRARKQRYKDVYGWADGRPAVGPVGLGDRKVGGTAIGAGNASGTTLRYPGSRSWAGLAADGSFSAFAVRGGQLVHWRPSRPGAPSPGERLPGKKLLPHVSAVPAADGGWQLFVMRQGLAAAPDQQVRDVWSARLPARSAHDAVSWEHLGSPNAHTPARRRHVGPPLAVALPGGRLLLLARNAGKGLSARYHDGSCWTPWRDLGGRDTQEGLTGVALDDRTVEVLAAAGTGVARWVISTPELTADFSVLRTDPPAGPPTVVRLPDGGRVLFHRCRDSASIVAFRTRGSDGAWDPYGLRDLGGHGGPGPVAAHFVPGEDAVLVAVRDDDSATSLAWVASDGRAMSPWLRDPTPIAGSHTVALDAAGRPVVVAVSAAGNLLTMLPTRTSITSVKEAP